MDIEKKILNLRLKEKMGYKKIAKELHIGITKTSEILIKNGITDHILMPEESTLRIITEMYKNNSGMREIVNATGISRSKISSLLKILDINVVSGGYHRGFENKINHNYFDTIDTEKKAYWLGFLFADGYNNENFYQIELTLKKEDKYMLMKLKNDLDTIYEIRDRTVNAFDNQYECSRLTVYSKQISESLSKLGCTKAKTFDIKFPDYLSTDLIHHFMRGYFDGDGCISLSKDSYKFSINGTRLFLDKFAEILHENTNITHNNSWGMDGKAHRWEKGGRLNILKIYEFLYKDSTIYLERKRNKFLSLSNSRP